MKYLWQSPNRDGTPCDWLESDRVVNVNTIDELYNCNGTTICVVTDNDLEQWSNFDRSKIDLCVFLSSESRNVFNVIERFSDSDIIIFGCYNGKDLYNPSFLYNLSTMYTGIKLPKVTYSNDILFNCLLGGVGPQRTYMYYKLMDAELIDKHVVTYRATPKEMLLGNHLSRDFISANTGLLSLVQENNLFKTKYGLLEKSTTELDDDFIRNQDELQGFYNHIPYCWYIPHKIYEHTNFGVCLETSTSNESIFITEKTIKYIAAGLPFISIGSSGLMSFLRQLGFKTFEDVLDQSYDEENNIKVKIDNVVELLRNLSFSESQWDKVKSICKHNQQHFFNTSWDKEIKDYLKKVISKL